jgi:hypothetical protein
VAAGETAGPSTALRSGRDDNSVAGADTVPLHLFRPLQNCRPDRGEVQWRDLLFLLQPGVFPGHPEVSVAGLRCPVCDGLVVDCLEQHRLGGEVEVAFHPLRPALVQAMPKVPVR